MMKLIKYEFRKTWISKLILLLLTALAELLFLAGIFLNWDKGLAFGSVGLVLCALVGIFYIGIESLLVFHKDLNTKQSYMLFMIPKNSYHVLGAKILENGISIFLAGLFFAALAAADTFAAVLHIGALEDFLTLLRQLFRSMQLDVYLSGETILMSFFSSLASWLMTIVTGYLAIVLSATFLAGKKFSGLVSFLLFLLLTWICVFLIDRLPALGTPVLHAWLVIFFALLISALMYILAGWMMERKLSV